VRIPPLLYLGSAAEALPLIAAVAARRPVREAGAGRWLAVWSGVLVAADGLQLVLALRGLHNLWISYVATAASALVLWALSCWQIRDTARLTLRMAVVPFLVVWAVLTVVVEDTSTFSRAAEPMADLICLAAAAYTLLVRSFRSRADVLRQGWFWGSAGLALYFGVWSAMGPLGSLLVHSTPSLLAVTYQVAMLLNIVAFAAVARGVTCPEAT
jgi:hypothetical protein